jgi:hypothetical protein
MTAFIPGSIPTCELDGEHSRKYSESGAVRLKRLKPERNKIVNEIIDIDYCGTTGLFNNALPM